MHIKIIRFIVLSHTYRGPIRQLLLGDRKDRHFVILSYATSKNSKTYCIGYPSDTHTHTHTQTPHNQIILPTMPQDENYTHGTGYTYGCFILQFLSKTNNPKIKLRNELVAES
jgi:hypothetical protein